MDVHVRGWERRGRRRCGRRGNIVGDAVVVWGLRWWSGWVPWNGEIGVVVRLVEIGCFIFEDAVEIRGLEE